MPAQPLANARTVRVARARSGFVPVTPVIQRLEKIRKKRAVRSAPAAAPVIGVVYIMDATVVILYFSHEAGVIIRGRAIAIVRVTQRRSTAGPIAWEDRTGLRLTCREVGFACCQLGMASLVRRLDHPRASDEQQPRRHHNLYTGT